MNSFLKKLPFGETVIKMTENTARDAKGWFVPSPFFEYFGLMYLGPIDGHDIPLLERYLNYCKRATRPILLHVITKKGKGLEVAVRNPEKFHGASPYNVITGETLNTDKSVPNYQDAMGQALLRFAKKDERIVGITAAMASGTGLSYIKKELPKQFFDVGIAEEHAAVFAAGMACEALRPSRQYIQRSCNAPTTAPCTTSAWQKLPVVFCLDRAGLSPNDGATHHGVFDISYLRPLPNAVVSSPKTRTNLPTCFGLRLNRNSRRSYATRAARAEGVKIKDEPALLEIGKAEVLRESDGQICVWALGNMVKEALTAAKAIEAETGVKIGVVNARYAKPLDAELLLKCAAENKTIITIEDHVVAGGFGSAVGECLLANGAKCSLDVIGWPDKFIPHGTDVKTIRAQFGLSTEQITERIKSRLA